MDTDERDIYNYLKSWLGQFISAREICRRASTKTRFRKDPDWAMPALFRLVEKGIIETDSTAHFRVPKKTTVQQKKWIAPHIRRILRDSEKDFTGTIELEDIDEDLETQRQEDEARKRRAQPKDAEAEDAS